MAKNKARRFLQPKVITLAAASCFIADAALANPSGATVVHGSASIRQSGDLLQITNSPSTIINWQSFSIGASEITRFIQQSAASAVLNRVTTQNPSAILGALQSNGRVFLLNPNGIAFGASAQINVAGLVASTLGLSNEDFLAGRMRFTEVPGAGSINNQGAITTASGGSVYLVGSDVTNGGVITSSQGEVVLAAGKRVELVDPATPNLRVEVAAADNEARNLGTILSDAGRIGIYAGLVTQSGTVRADSAQLTEGGRIVLKASESVRLQMTSVLSAKGWGGGEIKVLGGESARVAGRLETSAPSGGDGGFIETSAKKVTVDSGTVVTTSAPNGKAGTWLVDPPNFVIAPAGGDITGATLSANLGSTNVTLTSDNGAGGVGGDVFVNDPVAWSSTNSLSLLARRNVDINQSVTSSGSGGINLYAGWDGFSTTSPGSNTGIGDIVFGTNTNVQTAGSVLLHAGSQIALGSGATIIGGANDALHSVTVKSSLIGLATSGGITGANINLFSHGRGIRLGAPAPNDLILTQADIDKLTLATPATGLLQIGDGSAEQIHLAGPITFNSTKVQNLRLEASGSITQAAMAPLTVTNLRADSISGNVLLDTANNNVSLLVGSSSINNDFKFRNSDSLTIGSMPSTHLPHAGISTEGGEGNGSGDVEITTTSGNLAVGTVRAGRYAILRATAGAITDANGSVTNVTAQYLEAAAANGIDLDSAISGASPSYVNATNSTSGGISLRLTTSLATVQNIHNAGGNNNLSGLITDSESNIVTGGIVIHGEWPGPSGSGGQSTASPLNPQHSFTTSGGDVRITLNSPRANTFRSDPYVYLLNAGGTVIAQDDDGGQGYVSVVSQTNLAVGTYTVVAATYRRGQVTPFDLSIGGSVTGMPISPRVPPPAVDQAINQVVNSTNQQISPPQLAGSETTASGGDEKDEKKSRPVCS